MKNYVQNATKTTPFISLDNEKGKVEIKGRSIPLNPSEDYKNIIQWAEEYVKNPLPITELYFEIEYFNMISAVYFCKMIKIFEELDSSCELIIHWNSDNDYDDLTMNDYDLIFKKMAENAKCKIQIIISIVNELKC